MVASSQGYVNLSPYFDRVCRQWRPARIDLVARTSGSASLATNEPLRICDLACGTGFAATVLALANPNYEVVGVDYNPTHIHHARQRAVVHDIRNVRFFNRSIDEVDDLDLKEFDLITMSGTYSWLNPEMRKEVRAFVRKYLAPGGFFGVHYMTKPGWLSVEAIWKLARDLVAPGVSDPAKRHRATIEALRSMAGSELFKQHPLVAQQAKSITEMTAEMFAHEYLTAHWYPEYHVDVARILAEDAGLDYVGDCWHLWRNEDAFKAPKKLADICRLGGDQHIGETLYDYVTLLPDRHALFHKGSVTRVRDVDLGDLQFGSLGPFGPNAADGISTPAEVVKVRSGEYEAILSAVADRSRTLAEIAEHPGCREIEQAKLQKFVRILAAGELLLPFSQPTEPVDVQAYDGFGLIAFNHEQLSRPIRPGIYALVSPVLGHALTLGELDVRFVEGLAAVGKRQIEPWLRTRFQQTLLNRKGGGTLQGDALLKHVMSEFEVFSARKLAKLCELAILHPE